MVLTRALPRTAAATLLNNNLGGMGPGPEYCNNESYERCGSNDLDPSSPYRNMMGASLRS